MRFVPYLVKESDIHGHGLFAARDIDEEETIGTFEGAPKETQEDCIYTLWIDDIAWLILNDLKYVNHSKDPNCILYDNRELWALRDIEEGEELTFHYGDDWNG